MVVLVVSSSEASVWWVGAGMVVVPRRGRCCASGLLERAVTDLLINPPLLVALAVFPSKSLLLDGNAMVHHMVDRSELASGHHLANGASRNETRTASSLRCWCRLGRTSSSS